MENGLLIFLLIAVPFADVISMTLRMRKEHENEISRKLIKAREWQK